MVQNQMFLIKVREAFEVIDKFLDWWSDFFAMYDKTPTIKQIVDKFQEENREFNSDILKKYHVVHMLLEYQDDLYFNWYIKERAKIIVGLPKNYRATYVVTKQFRTMMNTFIFKHVFNECCKEEVERKRNKTYALNVLYYKKLLPYEILNFKDNTF